jgi:hypothetical protein
MVSCTVTAFNKPITMHLPVMDHRNQAVKNPDAFVVNKNMMRCLVKAIACHGIGLYIYAGEDLPAEHDVPVAKPATRPAERTPYPAEKLETNLPKWTLMIRSGDITAEQIIKKIEQQFVLADEQAAAIRAIVKQEPAPA